VPTPTALPKRSSRPSNRIFVYFHERLDAKTVIAQLEQWFEHYNEYRPRKRPKMKTPRIYPQHAMKIAFIGDLNFRQAFEIQNRPLLIEKLS